MRDSTLATGASRITSSGASIVGRCRDVNEDAWGVSESAHVFIVADGCGGASSGRSAADIAVATIRQCDAPGSPASAGVRPAPRGMEPLAAAVHLANERIAHAAVGDQRGMGSAVAAIRFEPPWLAMVHVGDCRVYRYRRGYDSFHSGVDAQGGLLTRLTLDHDLGAEMLRSGSSLTEIAAVQAVHSTVITRALGVGGRIDIDVQYSHVLGGDLYLLCTDGLTRQLPDSDLKSILSDERRSLAQRCEQLVRTADERVGYDNVTVLLVCIE